MHSLYSIKLNLKHDWSHFSNVASVTARAFTSNSSLWRRSVVKYQQCFNGTERKCQTTQAHKCSVLIHLLCEFCQFYMKLTVSHSQAAVI